MSLQHYGLTTLCKKFCDTYDVAGNMGSALEARLWQLEEQLIFGHKPVADQGGEHPLSSLGIILPAHDHRSLGSPDGTISERRYQPSPTLSV